MPSRSEFIHFLSQFGVSAGGILAIIALGLAIYKVVKRLDQTIGVDEDGKTLSERVQKIEYQIWPNSGKSLADRMKRVEENQYTTHAELEIIKNLFISYVGPSFSKDSSKTSSED